MVFKKGYKPWHKGRKEVYTPEQLERMSEAHKGKKVSEDTKRKMSETSRKLKFWMGRKHSEESKKKMSRAHKGQHPKSEFKKGVHISPKTEFKKGLIPWNKGTKGIMKAWNKGKKMKKPVWNKGKLSPYSEESLKKMSISAKNSINRGRFGKGHRFSEESLKKISKSQKKRFSNLEQIKILKDSHKGQIPWNKGKQGVYSKETKRKIREGRAKQIFPIKDSLIEVKIQDFLKELNIIFLKHKTIKEIKHNYQCDIFIPSMNLIIECDGNYWHKYPFGKEIDHLRTNELIEKGFNVLRLWESDIKKMNLKDFIERIKSKVDF